MIFNFIKKLCPNPKFELMFFAFCDEKSSNQQMTQISLIPHSKSIGFWALRLLGFSSENTKRINKNIGVVLIFFMKLNIMPGQSLGCRPDLPKWFYRSLWSQNRRKSSKSRWFSWISLGIPMESLLNFSTASQRAYSDGQLKCAPFHAASGQTAVF